VGASMIVGNSIAICIIYSNLTILCFHIFDISFFGFHIASQLHQPIIIGWAGHVIRVLLYCEFRHFLVMVTVAKWLPKGSKFIFCEQPKAQQIESGL
jgi:hypothetical protein